MYRGRAGRFEESAGESKETAENRGDRTLLSRKIILPNKNNKKISQV